MRAQQGGVDVEGDRLGAGASLPGPLQGLGAGAADRFQQVGVDRLEHPVGGGLRRHLPEQRRLSAQDAEVTDVIPAVGDRDGEVAQNDAGIVGALALPGRCHRCRERCRQAEPVSQLHQQVGASVRDEALAVRPDIYGLHGLFRFHLRGVLLGSSGTGSQTAFSSARRTLPGGLLRSLPVDQG